MHFLDSNFPMCTTMKKEFIGNVASSVSIGITIRFSPNFNIKQLKKAKIEQYISFKEILLFYIFILGIYLPGEIRNSKTDPHFFLKKMKY